MSGIEAVFGAVASGAGLISLSIQLAESAFKLKRIYDAARDAPIAILDMIDDLDTMAMALRQLEQQCQRGWSSEALLNRCVVGCERRAAEIRRLIDKMESSMKRHPNMGRLYSAFRQSDVKELLDSLERAKTLLGLAHTMYFAQEQRQRDQQISDMFAIHAEIMAAPAGRPQALALLPQHSSSPQRSGYEAIAAPQGTSTTDMAHVRLNEENSEELQLDVASKRGSNIRGKGRRVRTKPSFRASIRPWFSQRVFGFAFTQAQWGWNLQLHTYNIVRSDSLIFKYCRAGNLAGVRTLFDGGLASPLDVDSADWTLLQEAVYYGHIDICRYLLGYSTWPDRAAVMDRALCVSSNLYTGPRDIERSQMYRLFLGHPDFDFGLDDSWASELWTRYCPDTECLQTILRNQPLDFKSQPLALRSKIALSLEVVDASGFLECVGLHASDGRLASIRGSVGNTVLHYIAERLGRSLSKQSRNEAQQWIALGVEVLRNGANPCSLRNIRGRREQAICKQTPLLDCLWINIHWRLSGYGAEYFLEKLNVWARMIQEAGLDLVDYGARECEIWESLKVEDYSSPELEAGIKVVKLVYGSTPPEWSLMTSRCWSIGIYALRPPPGAFTDEHPVPANILWTPTNQEKDEGPWTLVRRINRTEPEALIGPFSSPAEIFTELVNGTQDDSGVIMLMQNRVSRAPRASLRSHSQPPCLRRREVAYYAQQTAAKHRWLPHYHLCPFDSSWRFGCVGGGPSSTPDESYEEYEFLANHLEEQVFHVRSCAKGVVSSRGSIQQSWRWRVCSFLAEIANCQDSRRSTEGMRSMRHTGTPNCPQGCRKILLHKLKVPEELLDYHPTALYGGPEDDYDDDANDSRP